MESLILPIRIQTPKQTQRLRLWCRSKSKHTNIQLFARLFNLIVNQIVCVLILLITGSQCLCYCLHILTRSRRMCFVNNHCKPLILQICHCINDIRELLNSCSNDLRTSLDRDQFPPEEIKKLYHMRWGIESSFRELKYSIGISHLHTRKDTAAMQEVYARLIMYYFSQYITMHVVINQKAVRKKRRKWIYQANFTYAMHLCKDYFRNHDPDPPDITARIAAEILPVRPDRQDKRKTIVPKSFVWFLYRVA